MFKEINIQIKKLNSENDKFLIEAELDVLAGVKDVRLNLQTGECRVEFDNSKTEEQKLFRVVKELGYEAVKSKTTESSLPQKHVYFVNGMHCASCELTTEKALLQKKEIQAVDASVGKGQVEIRYTGEYPRVDELNELFKKDGYVFSNKPMKKQKSQALMTTNDRGEMVINKKKLHDFLVIFGVSLVLMIGFIILNKSGLSALISVNSTSALPMFLIFGLLAGLSSCAALVGGIILSMSKQWLSIYSKNASNTQKLQPHILFQLGRLISYGLLGALLGTIGGALQLSLTFSAILIFAVSIMMLFLALQMLGVKYFQGFQIAAPKFLTRYSSNEKNFSGRYMPFTMGALTFFLPCGFTITAQGLALASGNPIQGGLIMLFFALGTLPILLAIGFSSVKFSRNPHLANRFLRTAGVLVLFFALFNINAQLNVLGWTSLNDVNVKTNGVVQADDSDLPPIVNGKQILKMDASSNSYTPNKLKVRAGIPVRWEITDKGTSGCTNAVISKGLFEGQIALTPGTTSVKEFTPEKPGTYKFSCWMGMVSGVLEVVDDKGNVPAAAATEVIPSGASGCGCGGGSGSCGG